MSEQQTVEQPAAEPVQIAPAQPETKPPPEYIVISGQSAIALHNLCRQAVAPSVHMKITIANAQAELEAGLSGQSVVNVVRGPAESIPPNRQARRAAAKNGHNGTHGDGPS